MKILVACEESGVVTECFRNKGHDAWSCDIQPTSGNLPQYHMQCDIREIMNDHWDMMIAFPPCTDICVSGARHFEAKKKDGRQQAGIDFFMLFANSPIEKVCIENPVGIMSTLYRKPNQIIHPWQHGHGETKKTCLWLKGLPLLQPSNIVEGRYPRVWRIPPSPDRGKIRSKTYPGIAQAMADQWG